ncbi:MAG: hypothetical protein JRI52_10285 [Deltaproteobacteria bacterium]|nr:hypothetical protein [Deltaproteobacteria bacterium]
MGDKIDSISFDKLPIGTVVKCNQWGYGNIVKTSEYQKHNDDREVAVYFKSKNMTLYYYQDGYASHIHKGIGQLSYHKYMKYTQLKWRMLAVFLTTLFALIVFAHEWNVKNLPYQTHEIRSVQILMSKHSMSAIVDLDNETSIVVSTGRHCNKGMQRLLKLRTDKFIKFQKLRNTMKHWESY